MLLLSVLSIDSFLISLAIGMLPLPSRRKYQACLLFGLCDGVATLVGLRLNYRVAPEILSASPWIEPLAMCVWILFVGFLTYRIAADKRVGAFGLSLLPVILAVDNLLGPPSLVGTLPTAIIPIAAAFVSAGFALVGLTIGATAAGRMPRPLSIGFGFILLCLTPILF
jgi:putative Mn2+ efflux pump MntP